MENTISSFPSFASQGRVEIVEISSSGEIVGGQ